MTLGVLPRRNLPAHERHCQRLVGTKKDVVNCHSGEGAGIDVML